MASTGRARQARCGLKSFATIAVAAALCGCIMLLAAQAQAQAASGDAESATFATDDGLVYTVTVPASSSDDGTGKVTLSDGTDYASAQLTVPATVSQSVDGTVYTYEVTAVGMSAFRGNTVLVELAFEGDLAGTYSTSTHEATGFAIREYAFYGCTSLQSVSFPSSMAGIGAYAFCNCSALAELAFDDDASIYVNSSLNTKAIGLYAFGNCTSLVTVTLPPITSTTRYGDAYFTWSEYNPTLADTVADNSQDYTYTSGYMSYWHGGAAPVARAAFDSAFTGCSSLETLVLQAGGSALGMYAYFSAAAAGLDECESLQAIVFEDAQAYWTDPNGAMQNLEYKNALADMDVTLYYAVDFYATDDASVIEEDDYAASGRYGRVELARGASIDAIKAGDADALADELYADASLYADESYADGEVPDPNEVAAAAGLDTSVTWAWRLTDTQSQREGLTNSCSAYLVAADDISAGRIATPVSTALQKRCDQNFSRWFADGVEQDSTFDVERWYSSENTSYNFTSADPSDDAADEFSIVVTSSLEESFYEQVTLYTASGEAIELSSLVHEQASGNDVWFQYYDESTGELASVQTLAAGLLAIDGSGPLLVNVALSGYDGTLQTWVLVEGNAGSVEENYTDTAAGTMAQARRYINHTIAYPDVDYSDAPYAVSIGTQDNASALVAAGIAGVVDAPLVAADEEDGAYGLALTTGVSRYGTGTGTTYSYPASSFDDAASYAVAVYEAFEGARRSYGASATDYPWGDAAVLLAPDALEDVAAAAAAYAYAADAPVFFADDDLSVSDDTLACLADFSEVVVIGDASVFSDEAFEALEEALGEDAEVTRVEGDARSASSLALAVAELLVEQGLASPYIVTVSDASDVTDAVLALNLSGHEGGVTLCAASTADSKVISTWVRENRDTCAYVRLYGRSDANTCSESFCLYDQLTTCWDETSDYEAAEVGAGDTLALSGASFTIADDGVTLVYAGELWDHDVIPAGTYVYDGASYVLAADVLASSDLATDISSATVSTARARYLWTGSAVEPSATVTLEDGTVLEEGTDYELSYADNVDAGTATVTATGTGAYTGSASATFEVILFSDVEEGAWYEEGVYALAAGGYVTGYTDDYGELTGLFGVGDTMKRAQLATVIWRIACPDEYAAYEADYAAAGSYDCDNTSGLSDVSDDAYYTAAVNWAVSEGVITGYTSGTYMGKFRPGASISFQDMCLVIARYAGGADGSYEAITDSQAASTLKSFKDASKVSSYARAGMAWCVDAGLVSGYTYSSGLYLKPTGSVARERVATVLYRGLDLLVPEG